MEVFQEIESSNKIFQIEPLILFKYLNIQESIPFELFIKNIFYRIASNNSFKQHIFLKPHFVSDNFNIYKEINEHIKYSEYLKNLKNKNLLSIQGKDQDIRNKKINRENNQKKSSKKTKDSIDSKKIDEDDSELNRNLKCSFINLFKLKINEKEIFNKELEVYQKNIENKSSIKTKKSIETGIKYFADCNGLFDSSFKNSSKKYIFELLNCISINRDFYFFSNINPNSDKYNEIFSNNQIEEVPEIKFDFIIYNLKLFNFINLVIYLYNNIIDFSNLKVTPFTEAIYLDSLIKMKNKITIHDEQRIDIIGVIGTNINNEDNKMLQYEKYYDFFQKLKALKIKNKNDYQIIMEDLKIKNTDNNQILLFITDGGFLDYYKMEEGKKRLKEKQNSLNINSLLLCVNSNNNTKENCIIEKFLLDYEFKSKKEENNFCKILKDIKIMKKDQNYIKSYRFQSQAKQIKNLEIKLKLEDIVINYLKNNEGILIENIMSKLKNILKIIIYNMTIKIDKLELFSLPAEKINKFKYDNYQINIVCLVDDPEFNINEIKIENTNFFKFVSSKNIIFSDYISQIINEYAYQEFLELNKNVYEELKTKLRNSINIIIFITKFFDRQQCFLIEYFCQDIKVNYLSYFILYQKEIGNFQGLRRNIENFFNSKHILEKTYVKDFDFDIKKFYDKNIDKIRNNYIIYSKKKNIYNEIINHYEKYNKNSFFALKGINDNEQKYQGAIFSQQKEYLKLKIIQDISFYLTFSISIEEKNSLINEPFFELNVREELNKYIDNISKKNNKIFEGFESSGEKKELFIEQNTIVEQYSNNDKIFNELQNLNSLFQDNVEAKKSDVKQFKNKYFIFKDKHKENKILNIDINSFTNLLKENITSTILFGILKLYYICFETVKNSSLKDEFLSRLAKEIVNKE